MVEAEFAHHSNDEDIIENPEEELGMKEIKEEEPPKLSKKILEEEKEKKTDKELEGGEAKGWFKKGRDMGRSWFKK